MGPNPNPNENTLGVLMDVVLEMIEEVRHAIPEMEDEFWSTIHRTDIRRTQDDGGFIRSKTYCRDRNHQPSRFQGELPNSSQIESSCKVFTISRSRNHAIQSSFRRCFRPTYYKFRDNFLLEDVSDLHTTSFGI